MNSKILSSKGSESVRSSASLTTSLRRCSALWLVSIWLLLSVARQAFDLFGKLWALVMFDFVQLLALTSTLFAIFRSPIRRQLLPFVALFSLCSLCFNLVLYLWFCTNFLTTDHQQSNLLSFGLPFGHSFFLRHTPLCAAHFNLTTQRWEQTQLCPIPYSYLEGAQALLHAMLAALTLALTMAMLACNNSNDEQKQRMTNAVKTTKFVREEKLHSSDYTHKSGCYHEKRDVGNTTALAQNMQRRSFVRMVALEREKGNGQEPKAKQQPHFVLHHEHYSSLSTDALTAALASGCSSSCSDDGSLGRVGGRYSRPNKGLLNRNPTPMRTFGIETVKHSNRHQPPRAEKDVEHQTQQDEQNGRMTSNDQHPSLIHPGREGTSSSSVALPAAICVPVHTQRPPSSVVNCATTLSRGEEGRSSVTHQFVSFDPKSSNTLIRVRERKASTPSSDEEEGYERRLDSARKHESVPTTSAVVGDASYSSCYQCRPTVVNMAEMTDKAAIRQRVPPTKTGQGPAIPVLINAAPQNKGDSSSYQEIDYAPPENAIECTPTEEEGVPIPRGPRVAVPSAVSPCIYEAYVGCALDTCTSFPSVRGPPCRSLVDCSAASAIRLSRTDLCESEEKTENQRFLGMLV